MPNLAYPADQSQLSVVPATGMLDLTSLLSDTVDIATGASLPGVTLRQIYVGVGGNVKVTDLAGNTVTHVGVPSGSYIGPFFVKQVWSTGTTASSLIGYI